MEQNKLNQLKNLIKETTGEDPEDVLGGDLENRAEELIDCEKCGGETGTKLYGDEVGRRCGDCGWINMS